jgi:hypothetical protein
VITDEIQIIHRILKISDPITLPIHISYFFFIIAASVAATSGREVHAATMVAQIARSDTPNVCAIKTAAFTTKSEESTRIHRLASNFVQFNTIPSLFSEEFLFLFKKIETRYHRSNTTRYIIQNVHIQNFSQKLQSVFSHVIRQSKIEIPKRM